MDETTATQRSTNSTLWGRFRRGLIKVLSMGAIVYLAIIVYLMANETRLVYPGKSYPQGNWAPTDFEFEDVWFESEDGTRINGWFLPHPTPRFHILVCHGNAENVATVSSSWVSRLSRELAANVFVFDYRGFGRSQGTPTEPLVIADALAARNWLCQRLQVTPDKIVYFGSSLGGGVAVAAAADQPCQALILDRTFDQITRAAAIRYPFIPVSWLMRNRFDSLARIQQCPMPTFVSHFADDEVIAWSQGRRLFDASPAKEKEFYTMPGGHHLQALPDDYWLTLRQFMDRTFPKRDTQHSEAQPIQPETPTKQP